MAQGHLDLTLVVPPGREREAAAQMLAQMNPLQWAQLCALAAEVVMLQEAAATGAVYLVAPVAREHLAAVVSARPAK